jgi:uncharacterized membrane protein
VGAPAPGQGAPPPYAGAAPMSDNVASTLCYALGFITGIIFLVLAPYNQNRAIRFHAFQSIFLSVAFIALRILLSIVFTITGSFWFVFTIFWPLFSLAGLGIWLYMLLMTYQGKTIVLPVIGPLAQQQA